jgi:hypothetical protein
MFLKEASRVVRHGDEELPTEQAILRSLADNARKGKAFAQRYFLERRERIEREERQRAHELAATALSYKQDWTNELARLKQQGIEGVSPPIHPDNIHIDLLTGKVTVVEPLRTELKPEEPPWPPEGCAYYPSAPRKPRKLT